MNTDFSDTEALLRQGLARLADHAPQAVVQPDELYAPHATLPPVRRNWLKVGVPLTAALLGAGVTAYAATGQNDVGAATPVEAVEKFVAAVEAEDALGVLDIIVPEEAQALKASLDDLQAEATRTGVVDSSMSLSGVDGLSVELTGETYETEELGEGLATVRAATGELAVTFDPDVFPAGEALRPLLTVDGPQTQGGDISEWRLTTVQRNGRWFVSPSYTIAEAVRRASTFNVPATTEFTPEGFESPEAAVEAFYQRLAALDFAGLANLAAPGEGDALARYLPLWLPEIDSAFADGESGGLGFTITGLETSSNGEGRVRTLDPTAFRIDGSLPASMFVSAVEFQRGLPTVLVGSSGSKSWVIQAGEPIPATIEGLEPLPPDGVWPDGPLNMLDVAVDGTVSQPSYSAMSTEPLTFTAERRDGCTTITGPAVRADSVIFAGRVDKNSRENGYRSCEKQAASGSVDVSGLLLFGGTGAFEELPSVTVVEQDGKWFVSPLGTIAGQFVDLLRTSEDPFSIDGPLARQLYFFNRADADRMLKSTTPVPAECNGFVESSSGVNKLVAEPSTVGLRACIGALASAFSGNTVNYRDPSGVAVVEGVTAETIALPASTATPAVASSDEVATTEPPATDVPPPATTG